MRYAPNIGGIERSAQTIAPMIPQTQSSKLRAVLEAEDETTTAQRLGFILEAQGADKLARTIRAWLLQKLAWIALATHAPENLKTIAANNRWQLFSNTMSLSHALKDPIRDRPTRVCPQILVCRRGWSFSRACTTICWLLKRPM